MTPNPKKRAQWREQKASQRGRREEQLLLIRRGIVEGWARPESVEDGKQLCKQLGRSASDLDQLALLAKKLNLAVRLIDSMRVELLQIAVPGATPSAQQRAATLSPEMEAQLRLRVEDLKQENAPMSAETKASFERGSADIKAGRVVPLDPKHLCFDHAQDARVQASKIASDYSKMGFLGRPRKKRTK